MVSFALGVVDISGFLCYNSIILPGEEFLHA